MNPNSKIPALMDYSQQTPQRVFESGAIPLAAILWQKGAKFICKVELHERHDASDLENRTQDKVGVSG